jgi:hypothetical protein
VATQSLPEFLSSNTPDLPNLPSTVILKEAQPISLLLTLMVLSSDAERRLHESAEKATRLTPPVCALITDDRLLLL